MKLKASKFKVKRLHIIRPEIEIEYTKHPILGRLYIMCNYWRFIKFVRCQVLNETTHFLAFPRIYRKADHE